MSEAPLITPEMPHLIAQLDEANHDPEEPDAFIALVRFCGGRRTACGPGGPVTSDV
jgi:hypothetical protein